MTEGERIVKKFLQRFGILIRKYTPGSSEDLRRIKLFDHHKINLVFDVGANNGQYAKGIIDNGYQGRIVSFEPLSSAHANLSRAAAKYQNWKVAHRCALGKERSEMEINIAENSVSSTLKEMNASHSDGLQESKIISREKVPVLPLDEASSPYIHDGDRVFIKIDVEGFEHEVISGGMLTIDQAIGIEMEISIIPLYTGQTFLLPQVLEWMSGKNFKLVSITPGFTNFQTGEVMQCNGIFFRSS